MEKQNQNQFNSQQKYRNYFPKKDHSYKAYQTSSFSTHYKTQKSYGNSNLTSNEINSTSQDSHSFQNSINMIYDKHKIIDNIILTNPKNFVCELFKVFGDDNTLCNFSLFQKNVDINMNLDSDSDIMNKITLKEYFESFIEGSFLCLNIPFVDKKGNINYNVFNPTLSSMNLIYHQTKIKENKINMKYLKDNYKLSFEDDDTVKIEFDESNPPYNRDIIETKIKNIHKLLKKKKIYIKDINKEKSYFSILWTPADSYKIKSSFLSFYTFDFKLIGTLIIKLDEFNWFTTFVIESNSNLINNKDNYNGKDFKKDYVNSINDVENFIKKCSGKGDGDNLDRQSFSNDYKRFINKY